MRIQLLLLHAGALDLALDPQEGLGPDRLRTGIPAPDAPGQRGDEEQRQTGYDQQCREVDKVLRPQGNEEDMELARRQVKQQRLAPVPLDPRQDLVDTQQAEHTCHAHVGKQAMHLAWVDLLRFRVEGLCDLFVAVVTGSGSCHVNPLTPVSHTIGYRKIERADTGNGRHEPECEKTN